MPIFMGTEGYIDVLDKKTLDKAQDVQSDRI
jgi:hypothetical protein